MMPSPTLVKIALSLATALLLAVCVTAEDAKAVALRKAQDQCAAEGKQFVLKDATGSTHFDVLTQSANATISGSCVGPGEPGYVPTEKKAG